MIEWFGDFLKASFFRLDGLRPHMLENAEITPKQGQSVLCKQFFLEVIKNVA